MEKLQKEVQTLIRKSTIRDIQIKLLKAKEESFIIPDLVFEIIQEVEDSYTEDIKLKPYITSVEGLSGPEEALAIKAINKEIAKKNAEIEQSTDDMDDDSDKENQWAEQLPEVTN